MNGVDEELRELLRRKADSLEPLPTTAPPRVLRRARRRAATTVIAGVVAVAALVAGGVLGVSRLISAAPGVSVPASPGPSGPVASPSTSSPSPRGGLLPPCNGEQLRLTDQTQGAAGSAEGFLVFRNVSSAACTVTGRPTISLRTASGSTLTVTVRPSQAQWQADAARKPQGWPVVTVRPGRTAGVRVRWTNECPQITGTPPSWVVTVPGAGALAPVTASLVPPCNGPGQPSTLDVGPFEPLPAA